MDYVLVFIYFLGTFALSSIVAPSVGVPQCIGSVFSVSLQPSLVFLVMVTVDQVRQKYNVILLPY